MRPRPAAISLFMLLAMAWPCRQAPAQAPRLLTDFTGDLPARLDDATLSLRLEAIRPLDDAPGDVVAQLQWRGGRWAADGHTAAADYNEKSKNTCRPPAPMACRRCRSIRPGWRTTQPSNSTAPPPPTPMASSCAPPA